MANWEGHRGEAEQVGQAIVGGRGIEGRAQGEAEQVGQAIVEIAMLRLARTCTSVLSLPLFLLLLLRLLLLLLLLLALPQPLPLPRLLLPLPLLLPLLRPVLPPLPLPCLVLCLGHATLHGAPCGNTATGSCTAAWPLVHLWGHAHPAAGQSGRPKRQGCL